MDNVSDASDYEELPDINMSSMAIQPYMFEPTISKEGEKETSETESEHEDESSDDQVSQAEEESVIDADDVSLWWEFLTIYNCDVLKPRTYCAITDTENLNSYGLNMSCETLLCKQTNHCYYNYIMTAICS
jgi:hypothetical protein